MKVVVLACKITPRILFSAIHAQGFCYYLTGQNVFKKIIKLTDHTMKINVIYVKTASSAKKANFFSCYVADIYKNIEEKRPKYRALWNTNSNW